MTNPQPKKYLAKVYWKSGKLQRVQRDSNRRISAFFQTINWLEIEKIYLRVEYSPITNNLDQKVIPYNEGEYSGKAASFLPLNCFVEK